MLKLEHAHVRKVALNECYRICRQHDLEFILSFHFTQRINLRAVNQDQAFINLLRSVSFMAPRFAEFSVLAADGEPAIICTELGAHRYFMRGGGARITCLTYIFNDHPNKRPVNGRLFRIKE